MLIYKYDKEEMDQQDDFLEVIMNNDNLLESIYSDMDQALVQSGSQVGQD